MPLDDPSQHNCQRFADRYVEYELVLLVIDLILLRPQVYRHLLFNRIPYHDRGIDVGPYACGRTATPTAADCAVLGGERALNRNGSRRWPSASSSSMSVRAQQCTRPPLFLTTDAFLVLSRLADVRAAYLDGLSSGYVTAWAATMTAMQVFACTVLGNETAPQRRMARGLCLTPDA